MKPYIRTLGYRDRSEIGYKLRIYLFIIFVGLFAVSDFYGNVRDYLNYSEDLEHVTDPQGGFAFLMAMDAESCKEDAFTFLAVELPLYTLLMGICIYFTTVLAQGNKSGWNRYLRTLPITPVMRAKSMLWSRGVIFVICTLCVTAFSGAFSWVVFGRDIALKAIPAALITSLIVETSDLLVNSIVVRWVLTADKKYSDNISFTAGLFPMLFLSLGLGSACPGHTDWADCQIGFSFNYRWIIYLLVLVLINIIGCLILVRNFKKYYE